MTSRQEQEAAERIQAGLKELEGLAAMAPASSSPATPWRNFPGFWRKATEISEMFRTSVLTYEDRIRLWQQHQDLCDRIAKFRLRERRMREDTSKRNLEEIMAILKEADHAGIDETRLILQRALNHLKEDFLLRTDRAECWAVWHAADRRLEQRRVELHNESRVRKSSPDLSPEAVERIQFLSGVIEQKKQKRGRLLRQIEELREGIQTSWNLEWASRAKRWLVEKEAKIRDCDADIDSVQKQIESLRNHSNV